jgi:hypothetical protein
MKVFVETTVSCVLANMFDGIMLIMLFDFQGNVNMQVVNLIEESMQG